LPAGWTGGLADGGISMLGVIIGFGMSIFGTLMLGTAIMPASTA
jgi:hypothetical protein